MENGFRDWRPKKVAERRRRESPTTANSPASSSSRDSLVQVTRTDWRLEVSQLAEKNNTGNVSFVIQPGGRQAGRIMALFWVGFDEHADNNTQHSDTRIKDQRDLLFFANTDEKETAPKLH